MSHGEVTVFGDVSDGPAVAVFHPVGGRESEASIVRSGDDHISDTRAVSVPETHFLPGRGTVATMITGSAVELSDQLAGGSEHDRVESDGSVENPSGQGILGDLCEITDVNTAMIKIEAECCRCAVAEHE